MVYWPVNGSPPGVPWRNVFTGEVRDQLAGTQSPEGSANQIMDLYKPNLSKDEWEAFKTKKFN